MQKINPFIWFNDQAEEAANFYASIFKNGKVKHLSRYSEAGPGPAGTVMMATLTIAGTDFLAMNGGPHFHPTASISFAVSCETPEEIDTLWKKLSDGGSARMPIDSYPWSERYGWIEDRFGVNWQLNLTRGPQSISPCLLFAGSQQGRAEEAIKLYTALFPSSSIGPIFRYEESEPGPTGQIKHSSFVLNGQPFSAMDAGQPMEVEFTPGISLMIYCDDQKEVDTFWDSLAKGGRTDQCGWLQDKFGVSWQVTPTALMHFMQSGDPERSKSVFKAMMTMTKLDIAKLEEAYEMTNA